MAPTLLTRQLGRDGPQVDAIGTGLMGLSVFYGQKPEDEQRLKFLDYVYSQGSYFWDSADIYGDSEDLVGKWFTHSGKRADIFIATKFANTPKGVNNSPEYIRQACDKSRSRLGLKDGDPIDLYYCHRLDPEVPVEQTVATMAELKKEGKIRYLGLSEVSAKTLRRACEVHHIAAVQMEYSPFSLEIEKFGVLEACRELGVALIAYSPLSRGFLTGSLKSWDDFDENDRRRVMPRFSKENFPKNIKLVEKVEELAKKKGCTSSQLVLAWLMGNADNVIPIPGTKQEKYLDENIGSLEVTLSEEESKEIRDAAETAEITGDRYPQEMLKNLLVDTVSA